MLSRERSGRALVLVVAFALIACASLASCAPAPTATPSPTSTSSLVVTVEGGTIAVPDPHSLEVTDIPYSVDVRLAVAALSDATGVQPTITNHTASPDGCDANYTAYDWDGLELRSPAASKPDDTQFSARVTAATSAGGVALQTSNGQHVGSTVAEMQANVPDAFTFSGDGATRVFYSVQNPDEDTANGWGAIALAPHGVVTDILAPQYFYGDC
ncbi:MAG: hypothetical protein EPN91_09475 [Salinibacterium sp.]|nr:MAG: hypothetical protein EPN91_09475 [Salinibacterium sp.]